MLLGVKYIPRDQIETAQENEDLVASTKEKRKLGGKKDKHRRKKKRQSSDEYSSFSEIEVENSSDLDDKKYRNKRKGKKIHGDSSEGEASYKSKRIPKRRRKRYSSKDPSSSSDEHEDSDDLSSMKNKHQRGSRKHDHNRNKDIRGGKARVEGNFLVVDNGRKCHFHEDKQERKEMGLEWMVKPVPKPERDSTPTSESQPEEPQVEELKRPNPRELNPYLKDNGSGYPEDADQTKVGSSQLFSSSVIGDGGASWRLKALKRAQEQAARDGRKLDEVVGERWGSLGQLAVSASSRAAAPSRAHLHAIKDRKRWVGEQHDITADSFAKLDAKDLPSNSRENTPSISHKHPEMKEPKVHDSLQWRRKDEKMSTKDAGIISAAMSNVNKFSNDGTFMAKVIDQKNNDQIGFFGSSRTASEKNEHIESELVSSHGNRISEDGPAAKPSLNANQLAAKALQLRMKGKHEEAEKLLKEAQSMDVRQDKKDDFPRQGTKESFSRYVIPEISVRQKEEDADMHLVQKIVKNKQYSTSGHVDDEYEFGDSPSRKKNRRKGVLNEDSKLSKTNKIAKCMLTQQDRCQFCFENPTRPRHCVISIANFTYLMLPQWQPVVPGHCCILPMQHESSMRTVDNNVWEEIRNFKKCLIVMFAKQEKGVVFLETVMGLAKQRRHCLVECIPLPQDVARQAPLYFKKAIDEAEDEWSQHDAKKLIDTSEKGLRGSIPKDFPYFYVEFGLDRGFVHVIDDETQFKSNFGLNVIRGMLQLPEEDMYRRQKHESAETQKHAVAAFAREWEPFDWTKQL